jgi:hypothetical protein
MKMKNSILTILSIIFLYNCTPKSKEELAASGEESQFIPETWVSERVLASAKRLQASPGGVKIFASIEAHGGLTQWFRNGPVSFHFDYQPLGGGTRRNTFQTVDKWSSKAVHELWEDRSVKFGWDGKNAWQYPDTASIPMNPRFWSLTPYYFLGLPFVLADDGVILTDIDDLTFEGKEYDLVKATYETGTGDASGDFYVIYIDKETDLMAGLRYIVSYPGFYPDGGHSPEKFMKILDLRETSAIKLATGYHTHWWKNESLAAHITTIEVSDVSFNNDLNRDFFQIPAGAKTQEGY